MPIVINGESKSVCKYRLKYGMSLVELADRYGFSTGTIYRWDREEIPFHKRIDLIPQPKKLPKTQMAKMRRIAVKVGQTLSNIKQRCTNPSDPKFKYYGGKGIQPNLTLIELMHLWERDKADEMKEPSIDRVDNNGHYEFSNCRFIEFSENSARTIPKNCS